jgi:PleD family two-component response regulator
MSEAPTDETPTRADAHHDEAVHHASHQDAVARRALLVVGDGVETDALREKLTSNGFEVASVSAEEAARRVAEMSPSVVVLAFGNREGEGRLLSLARRLRSEPSSFSLPVVFLYGTDGRTLRSAAQHLGADDYFALDATAEELRARLEALNWRAESGRRSAPAVADQRSEIDNFLFLLDAVSADALRGATGAVALVEANSINGGGSGDSATSRHAHALKDRHAPALTERRATALTDAHGFLKLNLRRIDAVAFYGPATLLVYLPGADLPSARATLSRLRAEFSEASAGGDLFIGISSFPAHASEVEVLVEQAEAALGEARAENSVARVVVYGVVDARPAPDAERRTSVKTKRRKITAVSDGPGPVNEPGTVNEPGPVNERETVNERGTVSSTDDATTASLTEPSSLSLNEAAARAAVGAHAGERRVGGRLRRVMLVVSDAARMAQVNLLMRSAAYEVRAAFDGHHALNLLRIDRPDALVVDYELPEMDGVEMLRRLAKQSRAGQAPPALLLLPAGREDLRDEALRAGARAVIALPYDAVELLDMLRVFCETE